MARILIVDDEVRILSIMSKLIQADGHEPVTAQDGIKALELLESEDFDLLISDLRMSPMDGTELTRQVRDKYPQLPVIIMTGNPSISTALQALNLKVFDYLTKPFKIEDLKVTIDRALDSRNTFIERGGADKLIEQYTIVKDLIAVDPEMKHVYEMVKRIALTDLGVLITGEFGSGRETIARTLHACSQRKDKSFATLPCAEFPEPILEKELFGHVGRTTEKKSSGGQTLMQRAEGGTVFLKDFHAMPCGIQEKLLKFLKEQEKNDEEGGNSEYSDVRLLAGTNADLRSLVEEGAFSRDLYYHLNLVKIEIKPLRKRTADILPLAMHILRQQIPEENKRPRIMYDVRNALVTYSWPGNVSELRNVIKHAIASTEGNAITIDALPSYIADTSADSEAVTASYSFQHKALKKFLKQKITNSDPSV